MGSILALLLAVNAAGQPQPAPRNDELDWAEQVKQAVPPSELATAAALAEASRSSDPLLDLARKHNIQAPRWLLDRIEAQGDSVTLAALGDSVTAATAACAFPYLFCPEDSWAVGDSPTSLKSALRAQSGRAVDGLLVSVPSVTMRFAPAEAFVVFLASAFGLNVERVSLLMGHNEPGVCAEDEPDAEAAFEKDFVTTLRILRRVRRRRGAKLFVSAPLEVPAVLRYAAVTPAGSSKTCRELWAESGRCRRLIEHPERAAEVSARLASYSEIMRRVSAGRDWILFTDALNAFSRAGTPDPAASLSRFDCYHPSARGQAELGAAAWDGALAPFFALEPPALAGAARSVEAYGTRANR